MTTRIQAQFRVQSDSMSIEELTRALGMEPNRRRKHKHADREWILGTEEVVESNDNHLEHCVKALCDAMKPAEGAIRGLAGSGGCRVIVSGIAYCAGRAPIVMIGPATMRQLIEYEAAFEADIYNV